MTFQDIEENYYYHGTEAVRVAVIKKSGLHTEMNHFDRRWKHALRNGPELLRVHCRHMPKDTMFDTDKIHAYTRSLIKPSFIEMHQAGHWVRITTAHLSPEPQMKDAAPSFLGLNLGLFRSKRA